MLNVHYITGIQMAFTEQYITSMLKNLKSMGYGSSKPFSSEILVAAPIPDTLPIKAWLTVQQNEPQHRLSEYHIWLKPLSQQIYIITPQGPMLIDTVYGILNGSEGIEASTFIDDNPGATW